MSLVIDIKYAVRQLVKAPKFAALTLIVLVGGLSVSLFTFSFLYSVIYKPLPIEDGESVRTASISVNGRGRNIPAFEFSQVRSQLDMFSEIGVFDSTDVRYSYGDSGKSLRGVFAEPGMFSFTRTKPIIGRLFMSEDMLAGAKPVVILSHRVWTEEFSSKQSILGETIRLNDIPTTVIGVMPENYAFPINTKLWLPFSQERLNPVAKNDDSFRTYMRVKSGVSETQAVREFEHALNIVYQQNIKGAEEGDSEVRVELMSFPYLQVDGEGNIFFFFFNAVAVAILLLACINVGNLLLAKAIEKRKETAIRAALGAPIKRLTLQLMLEGIIITLLGVILSVLLVADILELIDTLLKSALSNNLPFWWGWGMDWETLVVALVFTIITIILAVFFPAWRSANQDINDTLRDGTRGAQGKKAGRASKVLVTTQIFIISLLMLIGSVSGFISHYLMNLDIGENYDEIIRAGIVLPKDKYQTDVEKINFFSMLRAKLLSHGDVHDAVITSYIGTQPVKVEGFDSDSQPIEIDTILLTGNTNFYGPKLIAGRLLDERDNLNGRKVAIISESMEKRYWPEDTALEKQIKISLEDKFELFSIVGVVTDRFNGASVFSSNDKEDEIYISGRQFTTGYQTAYFKHSGEISVGEERLYQALYSIDRNVEPYRVEAAERNFEMMKASMRVTSNITFGAGGFALLLALTGIYGLTANAINQKIHEIGIRRAVGATDSQIIRLFLKQGAKQLIIGLSLALFAFSLCVIVFSRFIDGAIPNWLFLMLAVFVSIGMTIVVLAAVYIPTARSVKMEPSAALRYE